jgi:hypothetical protein
MMKKPRITVDSTKLTIDKYTGFREFMKSGVGENPRIFSSSNVHE